MSFGVSQFHGPWRPTHVINNGGHRYLVAMLKSANGADLFSEREWNSVDSGTQWHMRLPSGALSLNGRAEKRARITPLPRGV